MSSEFAISDAQTDSHVALIRIAGRLDAKSAHRLFSHCREKIQGGHRHLIINLSQVSFVASSGIGTLLALTEELKQVGGSLRLVELSEPVESVVRLLNLVQFLSIDASEDKALEASRLIPQSDRATAA